MNLDKNLVALRRQNNMSQEDLADKLGVSRQTIYKWETGATYPDTDKLMDIAKLFKVSVEKLINDEISEDDVSKDEILSEFKKFSWTIAISVCLILFGVAFLVLVCDEQYLGSDYFGLIVLLTVSFISTLVIIFSSIRFHNFKNQNDLKIEFSKKEVKKESNKFLRDLLIGLVFIFCGIIFEIIMSIDSTYSADNLGAAVLIALIGVGVVFFIVGGIRHNLYSDTQNSIMKEKDKKFNLKDSLAGIIMLLATVGFFVWGFIGNGWQYSWICFAIGGILVAISSIICDLKK